MGMTMKRIAAKNIGRHYTPCHLKAPEMYLYVSIWRILLPWQLTEEDVQK